jgi:hypothetical protein
LAGVGGTSAAALERFAEAVLEINLKKKRGPKTTMFERGDKKRNTKEVSCENTNKRQSKRIKKKTSAWIWHRDIVAILTVFSGGI